MYRFIPVLMKISLLTLVYAGCGIEPVARRNPIQLHEDQEVEETTNHDSDATVDDTQSKNSKANGETLNQIDGKAFFTASVSPAMRLACSSCHAEPRENPPMQGPLTIFSYASMKSMLANGGHPLDNAAINKPLGRAHGGGKRCNDDSVSPCKELAEWWAFEFQLSLTPRRAQVARIGLTGEVVGWAVNLDDATETVILRPYVNGDDQTGVALADVMANTRDYDNNAAGDHGFRFTIPAQLADGTLQRINLYAVVDAKLELLTPRPLDVYGYLPKQAGMDYFRTSIQTTLQNNCGNCHRVAYDQQYAALSSPAPYLGGSTTRNDLVQYASGGNNHRGGNFCGNGSQGVCALFAQWWNLEFGR